MALNPSRTFLITGGAGYIGSHFIEVLLADARFLHDRLVVLDNLSTGHIELLNALDPARLRITFENADLLDPAALKIIFEKYRPEAVLHFAAKISVAESVEKPDLYYQNNVVGSQNLLAAMRAVNCKKIVFSSTAAVYGMVTKQEPLTEVDLLQPINPYGQNKLAMELSIREAATQWGLNSVIFRYFNASGASSTGKIGEWHEPETHLIPLLLESVVAQKAPLKVFGNDYDTRDGSCIRDYIHVSDLADAHLLGLMRLLDQQVTSSEVYNLGTENGTSVLEVIKAAEKVCAQKVKIETHPRRPGDAAMLVASSQKAKKTLGWTPRHSQIEEILRTAYEWQKKISRLPSRH